MFPMQKRGLVKIDIGVAQKLKELLLQNEYLAAENRILRAKLPSRLQLDGTDREQSNPGDLGISDLRPHTADISPCQGN
jgi:hypothetical protein